jgi:OmcA/MtrC family decaheme c-type cytochrome
MSLVSRTALTLLAGLIAVPFTPVTRPGSPGTPKQQVTPTAYAASAKEAYLTPEALTYIRPGLNLKIASVTNVAPGKNPVVEILMTDDLGGPLDRTGVLTPGTIEVDFILAQWNASNYEYINLTTSSFGPGLVYPLHDSGGTWTDVAVGDSKYTFATKLPATFDVTQTVSLGVYAARSTTDIVGKDYNAPAVFQDFRPDGKSATTVFAAIVTSNCNKCHDPLSMHADHPPAVQDVKLCVMCHTSQMPITATGESLNFKVMVHKIHDGANLPSVLAGTPYVVSPGVDYSTVVFPQDLRNCQTCHASASATDAAIWRMFPGQAACGSCHDNINWTTGANHAGGQQINDASCANCHDPVQDAEWDASVPGAHTVEYKSTQLYGLVMNILSVTQAKPGQKPVVKYQITDRNGKSMDSRPFDTLRFTLGGPTTDYSSYVSENAQATTTWDGTTATYTFQSAVPATAKNTWMLTCDVELTVPLKQGDGKPDNTNFTESPLNPIFYIAMTDATAVPRRTIVDIAKCNVCHDRFGGHGGQRLVTQGCVICHNPVADDSSQRPASAGKPESIDLRRMIHRIHTGDQLVQDYTVYGHGGSAVPFNQVAFPGDRRDCAKCHTSITTAEVPTGATLNVVTQRDFFSPQGPATAACTGCHDSRDVAAHALINTAYFPGSTAPSEACATCHSTGATYAVDVVHAR